MIDATQAKLYSDRGVEKIQSADEEIIGRILNELNDQVLKRTERGQFYYSGPSFISPEEVPFFVL